MGYEYVQVDRQDGVFILTLNRPEKLNAINVQMDIEWIHALSEAEADPNVRVVLQKGAGRSFCAGHDLVEVGNLIKELGPAAKDWSNIYSRIWPEGSPMSVVAGYPKPIVSAVHGHVTGQAALLVLLTDMIVAAQGTVFNLEVVRTGGGAGIATFLGLLPPKAVAELAYLGILRVEDMLNYGAINRVVSGGDLDRVAFGIAKNVALVHPESLYQFKRNLQEAFARHGIGDVSAAIQGGVRSHGHEEDNAFWIMAAETSVRDAVSQRDRDRDLTAETT